MRTNILIMLFILTSFISCVPTAQESSDINDALVGQGCEIPPSFDGYTCKGRFVATNEAELQSYLSNYGLKNGNVKHLKIDFAYSAETIQVTSPCSITVRDNASLTSNSGSSCLIAKGHVKAKGMNFQAPNGNTTFASYEGNVIIDDNSTINTQNLNLMGSHKAVIQNTATITAHDINMKSFGTEDDARVHIRHSSNVTANNIYLEAKRKATLGRDSLYNVSGTVRIIGEGPDDDSENPEFATIWRNTTVNANELIIQSLSKTKIGKNITVNANRIFMEGPACKIGKNNNLNAPLLEGNCFSGDHPTAKLKVDVKTGEAPLMVNFDASKSLDNVGIVNYEWKLGDIETLTTTAPSLSYTFLVPGVHKVRLKVTDTSGLIDYRTKKITVDGSAPNPPPVVAFSCVSNGPFEIDCDSSLSTDDGIIQTRTWDMGDSTVLEGTTVSHDYTTAGLKNISLTLVDNLGAEATLSQDVLVLDNEAPIAVVNCSLNELTVTCDSNGTADSDSDIVEYKWEMGDGQLKYGTAAVHTYIYSGLREVKLFVKDEYGAIGEASFSVSAVKPSFPVAEFDCTTTEDFKISCDATASSDSDGNIIDYLWTMGDDTNEGGSLIAHTYSSGGQKSVTLYVRDNDEKVSEITKSFTITGNLAPVVDFECLTDENYGASCSPLNTSDPDGTISSYKWTFPDSTFLTDINISKVFSETGIQNVTLEVTDNSGGKTSKTKQIVIKGNEAPIADFSCTSEGFTITCNGSSSTDDKGNNTLSYSYNFEGNIIGELTPEASYTYNSFGQKEVVLTVTDTDGISNTISKFYQITAPDPSLGPIAFFQYYFKNTSEIRLILKPLVGSSPIVSGNYTILQTGKVIELSDFHHRRETLISNLTPGEYDIKLSLTDSLNRTSNFIHKIEFYPEDQPISAFSRFSITKSDSNQAFLNLTDSFDPLDGEFVFDIDWGDGVIDQGSEGMFFTHNYSSAGTYNVKVKMILEESGEFAEVAQEFIATSDSIPMLNPIADFLPEIEGDFALHVRWIEELSGSPNGDIISYMWDFGDGFTASGVNEFGEVIHFYDPGSYILSLTVVDSAGKSSTTSQKIIVSEIGADLPISIECDPVDAFSVECFAFAFDKFSEITAIQIDFGNGHIDRREGSFADLGEVLGSVTYTSTGTFNITATVETSRGETASVIVEMNIPQGGLKAKPTPYLACFNIQPDTLRCNANDSFDFDGEITSYEWDMGDGTILNENYIEHKYLEYGETSVTLTVTDNDNQTSSVSIPFEIARINQSPVALRECFVDKLMVTCDATKSKDLDGTIISYNWFFGDGGTASGDIVEYEFSETGSWDIRLEVTDNDLAVTEEYSQVTLVNPIPPTVSFNCFSTSPQSINCNSGSSIDEDGFITSYQWSVEEQISTFPDPSFDFSNSGIKQVKLKLVDNEGLESELVQDINVLTNNPPVISFSCNSFSPLFMSCNSNISDSDGSVAKIEWDLNGEEIKEGQSINHQFGVGEIKQIKLSVTDNLGAITELTDSVAVTPNQLPTGEIQVSSTQVEPGEELTLSAINLDDVDGFVKDTVWEFEDGRVLSGQSITTSFSEQGVYQVSLNIFDNLNSKTTVIQSITVSSEIIISVNTEVTDILPEAIVRLDATETISATGNHSVTWDFPDGSTQSGQVVFASFYSPGLKEFRVNIEDEFGRKSSKKISVNIDSTGPYISSEISDKIISDVEFAYKPIVKLSGLQLNDTDFDIISVAGVSGVSVSNNILRWTPTSAQSGTQIIDVTILYNAVPYQAKIKLEVEAGTVIDEFDVVANTEKIYQINSAQSKFSGSTITISGNDITTSETVKVIETSKDEILLISKSNPPFDLSLNLTNYFEGVTDFSNVLVLSEENSQEYSVSNNDVFDKGSFLSNINLKKMNLFGGLALRTINPRSRAGFSLCKVEAVGSTSYDGRNLDVTVCVPISESFDERDKVIELASKTLSNVIAALSRTSAFPTLAFEDDSYEIVYSNLPSTTLARFRPSTPDLLLINDKFIDEYRKKPASVDSKLMGVIAHEAFHRVQFASRSDMQESDKWLIESSADDFAFKQQPIVDDFKRLVRDSVKQTTWYGLLNPASNYDGHIFYQGLGVDQLSFWTYLKDYEGDFLSGFISFFGQGVTQGDEISKGKEELSNRLTTFSTNVNLNKSLQYRFMKNVYEVFPQELSNLEFEKQHTRHVSSNELSSLHYPFSGTSFKISHSDILTEGKSTKVAMKVKNIDEGISLEVYDCKDLDEAECGSRLFKGDQNNTENLIKTEEKSKYIVGNLNTTDNSTLGVSVGNSLAEDTNLDIIFKEYSLPEFQLLFDGIEVMKDDVIPLDHTDIKYHSTLAERKIAHTLSVVNPKDVFDDEIDESNISGVPSWETIVRPFFDYETTRGMSVRDEMNGSTTKIAKVKIMGCKGQNCCEQDWTYDPKYFRQRHYLTGQVTSTAPGCAPPCVAPYKYDLTTQGCEAKPSELTINVSCKGKKETYSHGRTCVYHEIEWTNNNNGGGGLFAGSQSSPVWTTIYCGPTERVSGKQAAISFSYPVEFGHTYRGEFSIIKKTLSCPELTY